MIALARLRRDQSGAGAVEFALAVPALIALIYGIFQVGMLFQASAGMQHALGEGARYATIFPTPTNAQIEARMEAKVFGDGNGSFQVNAPVDGAGFKTLSVTYSQTTNLLFIEGPTITMTNSKRVYVDA